MLSRIRGRAVLTATVIALCSWLGRASRIEAAVSIYLSPEALAQSAPLVVEGTVRVVASGYDPTTGRLATYVTLDVSTVHRGPVELPTIVLREPGGSFGAIAHDVDAAPIYSPGERVMVFAEASRDGALRTSGMFFGKFRLVDDARGQRLAQRELSGEGRIARRPAASDESFVPSDLLATVVSHPPAPSRSRAWRSYPPEWSRLIWDERDENSSVMETPLDDRDAVVLAPRQGGAVTSPDFAPWSLTNPARWTQSDSGGAIELHVQRSNDPLGDPAAAVAAISTAMAAWNAVPESRVRLSLGDDDYPYTNQGLSSPRTAYTGTNIVLFGDPYDDISDPVGCAGVLAIGGYWRSTSLTSFVNGVGFHPSLQLYVIFNDGFECYLGNPTNLEEVAAHELGHGLGFAHSTAPDALMRSTSWGQRGARLGDDDRDASHCIYPHSLQLLEPAGGENWTGGGWHEIRWATSGSAEPEPGLVDLEWSSDGGASWQTVTSGEIDDGSYLWHVPMTPSASSRARVVRRIRAGAQPAGWPSICTQAASTASFSIVVPPPSAGEVGNGLDQTPLRVAKSADDALRLSWDASCSSDVSGYALYEGDLAALRGGQLDPVPRSCDAGWDLAEYLVPAAGDRYYLITALAGDVEGPYGVNSQGTTRPQSSQACRVREVEPSCRATQLPGAGSSAASGVRSSADRPSR